MMDEHKQFLYQKIHEISEQKEILTKENESLKQQLDTILEGKDELISLKNLVTESLEVTDERLEEWFGSKTEEEKFAKYLLEIIKRKGLDPKQVISFMQTKVKE